ncbi:hypothetical protein [Bombilactobacillus thymidiniphilus]|uniref:Uncharacterized protein n=1 Tax=Bombilactobacillus thymidiniphilus TaxID=2923363 RepID=A0ABY4PCY7_9LACO|nr:hypothetical protein [Bombilactobacillus thymidiniphilus]UQS83609.1 hypothetical protein MOO47_07550 [Bombilactobacillus thymidiniphilus]UQS83618.1 hypothetical protein MOO47_07595 [Bombilactobacillus thymidiniphilus]UQS83629.1 hypothetical protein MOO47_00035 [Bombilactobacillus thymidiniphilus]UQS83638.1 hypothetical protein MOO47_00080 [Bombilactobacillus thymidiniphilus]
MIRQGIIRLFLVELKMEWITRMKYIMASIGDFVVFTVTFLAVTFVAPVSAVNSTYHTNQGLLLIMIGYMFWNLGVVAMDIGTQVIESAAKSGILEIEM